MAIPDLEEDGFLPEGIHECSLDDLRIRFGQWQRSDCRTVLFAKLEAYFRDVRATGMVSFVVVDGSFISSKYDPNDIDLILILREDHEFSNLLRPFEYNALSRRMVRKRYAFDVLVAREGSPELTEYLDFFQQVRSDSTRRKGIVKVVP